MTVKNEQRAVEDLLNQGTETKRKGIVGRGRALQTLSSEQSAYERWIARISSVIHPHAMRGGAGTNVALWNWYVEAHGEKVVSRGACG